MQSLIVFSHLRWDFPRQRPQHVLSRLAREWRILYVEEPVFHAGDPWAEMYAPATNVTVLRPHTPLTAPGFHDDQIPLLHKLVSAAAAREQLGRYGAWLYTPMALPLLQKLSPHALIYDCTDELRGWSYAPRQLVQRENALLTMANVVFTAAPSLHEARRGRNANVHLVGNGVDYAHFAAAQDERRTAPAVSACPRPRLGWFGMLDERIDLALLRGVAALRPEWEICLVGPVARVDPARLPQAANVHYLGAQRYGDLPAFLAGFDVCLLPFTPEARARFVCPLKTLEYMAAQKPIVATSIADVQRLYPGVVRFGDTPQAFVAACEAALLETPAARAAREKAMRAIAERASWDDAAAYMRIEVERAAAHGLTEAAGRMFRAAPPRKARLVPARSPALHAAACVIIGAGATGLAAAWRYGTGAVVLERGARVGGGCRSVEDAGFTFDRAGHVMFSNDPFVRELYRLLLGDNVHWQDRDARVFRDGVLMPYAPDPEARFGYPLRGGIEALCKGFLPLLRADLELDAEVERVSPLLRTVTLRDGRRYRYDTLISTIPLPRLVAALGEEAPAEIHRSARELAHTSVRCVNLGAGRPHLTDAHWIDFPAGFTFNRIFVQGNASPCCNPPGGFGLTCEIPYSADAPLPAAGRALIDRCVAECIAAGLIRPSDPILTANQVDVPYAYVVDDAGRAARVRTIRDWLAQFSIALAGLYGAWDPAGSAHAFIAGRDAADQARAPRASAVRTA